MVAQGYTMRDAVQRITEVDRGPQLNGRQAKATEAKRLTLEQRFAERLAEAAKGQPPEMVRVRVRDIHFDDRYQTDDRYDDRRARKMAEEWDWDREVPVKLNVRPGDPDRIVWCPDGRHRVNAVRYRFGEEHPITAILHSVPYAAEAAMFAHQDENRRRVPVALKFNAGKEAGEAVAVEIQGLADRLAITLGDHAGHRTVATKAFLELCQGKGIAATEEAFGLILQRWDGDTESMDSRFVKGVTWFVARYRVHPNYRTATVRDVLSKRAVLEIQREAGRFQESGEHRKIAAALVAFYNTKRQHRLPDWGSS